MDLFSSQPVRDLPGTPLAERMRPEKLLDIVGQDEIRQTLQKFVSKKYLPNMIFWGPPGTGKTTVAQTLSHELSFDFHSLNATSAGVKDLREMGEKCRQKRLEQRIQSVVFVDEIHRFNKGQQDVLLPFLEKGELILIGATTENPSYELNSALLSRCRLMIFKPLDSKDLIAVVERALAQLQILPQDILVPEALHSLVHWSSGDVRKALGGLEALVFEADFKENGPISKDTVEALLGPLTLRHDKSSDQHYDLISAMIKSVRGSDVDAGLYYLARLFQGGEDPVFIARRLVILASEDIGNADPRALPLAVACAQAVELIGRPECGLHLAHVLCYLASAPKSNSTTVAWQQALACVEKSAEVAVPLSLRSARTFAMTELGYGKGYLNPHDHSRHYVQQTYFPEELKQNSFYEPSDMGFEKQIREFSQWLRQKTR